MEVGEDVKAAGSVLGDVGGEESGMDLWDAVSLSSKRSSWSSKSARGFGLSVRGSVEEEKRPWVMVF